MNKADEKHTEDIQRPDDCPLAPFDDLPAEQQAIPPCVQRPLEAREGKLLYGPLSSLHGIVRGYRGQRIEKTRRPRLARAPLRPSAASLAKSPSSHMYVRRGAPLRGLST